MRNRCDICLSLYSFCHTSYFAVWVLGGYKPTVFDSVFKATWIIELIDRYKVCFKDEITCELKSEMPIAAKLFERYEKSCS